MALRAQLLLEVPLPPLCLRVLDRSSPRPVCPPTASLCRLQAGCCSAIPEGSPHLRLSCRQYHLCRVSPACSRGVDLRAEGQDWAQAYTECPGSPPAAQLSPSPHWGSACRPPRPPGLALILFTGICMLGLKFLAAGALCPPRLLEYTTARQDSKRSSHCFYSWFDCE